MQVSVNGELKEVGPKARIRSVLEGFGVQDDRGVAVAVDGEVVPRSQWEDVSLSEGQRIEILRAVQGG